MAREYRRKRKNYRRQRPIKLEDNRIYVFTDGACWPVRDGHGGWGVVLLFNDHYKELNGWCHPTTSNRMELTAILEGIRALHRPFKHPTTIFSDSKYCVNSLSQWWPAWKRRGWKTASGTPVKNLDLIEAILTEVEWSANCLIEFKWLPGHSGHKYNERADELAVEGRKACQKLP